MQQVLLAWDISECLAYEFRDATLVLVDQVLLHVVLGGAPGIVAGLSDQWLCHSSLSPVTGFWQSPGVCRFASG